MVKRLRVRIRPDGSIEAETEGMKGPECLPYIDKLETLIDAQAVDSWYTDEFYETEREGQAAKAHQQEVEGHG